MNNYDQISDDGHVLYSEAETMETRKVKGGARIFWIVALLIVALMFIGNYFISQLIN